MQHTDKIKDTDAYFEVDAITRQINNRTPAKIVLMQGDHNSERFTFSLPRFIEGHDMLESANTKIHYINASKNIEGMYDVDDLRSDPDDDEKVICSWLISGNVTAEPGKLAFLIEFECFDGNLLVYSWHTMPNTTISINETFDCSPEMAERYADILAQWEQRINAAITQREGINANTKVMCYPGVCFEVDVPNSICLPEPVDASGIAEGMFVNAFFDNVKYRGIIASASDNYIYLDTSNSDSNDLIAHAGSSIFDLIIEGGKYGTKEFDGIEFISNAEGDGNTAYINAHAEGRANEARGYASHAEGGKNIAQGEYAHAEGYAVNAKGHAAHAEGVLTTASGKQAHAEGLETHATARNTHAEGLKTHATGEQSHAEGYNTTASGGNSHAEGKDTTASGVNSHAEGYSSETSGDGSHAEGINTKASGYSAHSEGENSIASGYAAHAEGYTAHATGSQAHAEGFFTTAKGANSHAEGNTTEAWGQEAHIEGYSGTTYADATNDVKYDGYTSPYTYGTNEHIIDIFAKKKFSLAKGDRTHVEGQRNIAIGNFAHAEGVHTQAIGECSHTEGWNTQAHGVRSHAEGLDTVAMGENQHVQGKYNVKDTAGVYAHIVGGGTSGSKRKNIHTVDWDGNAFYSGAVECTGVIMNSPSGKRFRITVDDSGALKTAQI